MTDFKIGDVVWVRAEFCGYRGKRDRLTLKVGDGETVAIEGDCKADIEYDIKQAIRNVLLSEEFMTAFAAAWMKTPIPYLHDISFDNLKPGETLTGNYVWLGEGTEATNDPT